jgi:signal transduction histidine kinase
VTLALREDPRAALDPTRWVVETNIGVAELRADRIKLRQALRNLLANAVQAQPTGGRVVVDVRAALDSVELRVQDAGPGLAPHLRDRAGEPFLTTRAEGTGLGLALVHAIAAVHGGRFDIHSPGALGGTDAILTIPWKSA